MGERLENEVSGLRVRVNVVLCDPLVHLPQSEDVADQTDERPHVVLKVLRLNHRAGDVRQRTDHHHH